MRASPVLAMDIVLSAMRRADALAAANSHGGPFGSVVLGREGELLGEGWNQVVHYADPTCHAEMQALRDAGARHGAERLKGAVLVTSCECCPMCLAAAYAAGIGRIIYANTRRDAAKIGFADDAIYEEMKAPFAQLNITVLDTPAAQAYLPHGAEAAVVDAQGQKLAEVRSSDVDSADPTALPSVLAVSRACRSLGMFHLPDGARLITRQTVHALGFTAARWAHIRRIGSLAGNGFEGGERPHHPELVYEDIALPVSHLRNRKIPIERLADPQMLATARATFDAWFHNQNKVLY